MSFSMKHALALFLLHSLVLSSDAIKPVHEGMFGLSYRSVRNHHGLALVNGRLQSTNFGGGSKPSGAFNLVDIPSQSNCSVPSAVGPSDIGEVVLAPFDPVAAKVYRYRRQQAVNLGSWFVHEQWMTPSVFQCAAEPAISEIDIAHGWGSTDNARAVLEHHWDSFISLSDFQHLASIGINTVRLPIGYWSLGPDFCQGTPFESVASVYITSWKRVLRAVNYADSAGIGVLIDLHGAPGSQNGQPHSGISDGLTGLFNSDDYKKKTVDVLKFLIKTFSTATNVVGIQLLNEPENDPSLAAFYNDTIATLRATSSQAASLPLYIHDGFDLQRFSDFNAGRKDFIVVDHHSYFVFTPGDESEPASQHTADIHSSINQQLSSASDEGHSNLIIGEWSCALTAESLSNEKDPMVARQQFCQGQQDVYTNSTTGWSFWSYRLEGCKDNLDWCFENVVGKTLPSTFFSYSGDSATASSSWRQAVQNLTVPSTNDIVERTASRKSSSRHLLSRRRVHRFASIHGRRRKLVSSMPGLHRKDSARPPGLNDTEKVMVQGYSDGFSTAQMFAVQDGSKLGFKTQYIWDNMAASNSSVVPAGKESTYHDSFLKGLTDGEKLIATAVQAYN